MGLEPFLRTRGLVSSQVLEGMLALTYNATKLESQHQIPGLHMIGTTKATNVGKLWEKQM